MIPGIARDLVCATSAGYASSEHGPWRMPLCFVVAHEMREQLGATYVRAEVQVMVEDGLVMPIRISTVVVKSGLEPKLAMEKLKGVVPCFRDYTDKETAIVLDGRLAEPYYPDADVFPELGKCVTTVAVLGATAGTRKGSSSLLRQAAKSVVKTGLADRCLLWMQGKQLFIDTFATAVLPDQEILRLLHVNFDFNKAIPGEDIVHAMEHDMESEIDDVDLDPRISSFTRIATWRWPGCEVYPIRHSSYRRCDARPIVEALRCGWDFLPGFTCPGKPLAYLSGSVEQHPVSPMRQVPDHILKPEWASQGQVDDQLQQLAQKTIEVKTPKQVQDMREACSIARAALDAAAATIRPGVNTDAIDEVVHNTVVGRGAYPSWLRFGGGGHTKSCCTSVNEVLCNGVPDARPLKEGDIVTVYVAAFVRGVHGAASETFCVGEVDQVSKRLIRCSRECLDKVIAQVKPIGERCRGTGGVAYPQIGAIITAHAASFGLKPSKAADYAGIGTRLESAPIVPQYNCSGKPKGTLKEWLRPGHTLFLEPMILSGESHACLEWPGGALVSKDYKRNAACGKTVLVTPTGLEVL